MLELYDKKENLFMKFENSSCNFDLDYLLWQMHFLFAFSFLCGPSFEGKIKLPENFFLLCQESIKASNLHMTSKNDNYTLQKI